MKKTAIVLVLFFTVPAFVRSQTVAVRQTGDEGWELLVDGKPFFIKGVVWNANPPGSFHTFDLWKENDNTIRRVIDTECAMMAEAGVNAIRVGPEIPGKWVEYIYTKFGIYTIISDQFARWGITAGGRWYPVTNYFEDAVRDAVKRAHIGTVNRYKDVSGILMYMFGNMNNYGLYWSGPTTPRDFQRWGGRDTKAVAYFSLIEEVLGEAKELDPYHPMAIMNGDLGHLEMISEQIPSLDILGVNLDSQWRMMDRPGPEFWRDARVKLGKPVFIGEIGCQAWNSKTDREDQLTQSRFISSQWKDIYSNAYGKGQSNAIGACVKEWTDQWYASDYGAWDQITVHDTEPNGSAPGYFYDYTPGQNNMNDEWFGITSQGPRRYVSRFPEKLPRAAYYTLQKIWSVDPRELNPPNDEENGEDNPAAGMRALEDHFSNLDIEMALIRGGNAVEDFPWWKVSNRVTFTAMQTGHDVSGQLKNGRNIFEVFAGRGDYPNKAGLTGPELEEVRNRNTGSQWGVDLKTTLWGTADRMITGSKLEGEVTVWLRHDQTAADPAKDGPEGAANVISSDIDRTLQSAMINRPVDVYQARFKWSGFGAAVNGYYHSGKPGWGGSGDFFNFNAENWDLWGDDIWDIKSPLALEAKYNFGLTGMPDQGLSVIGGPRIYSGAAPMILAKWFQVFEKQNVQISALAGHEFAVFDTEKQLVEKPAGKFSLWALWSTYPKNMFGDTTGFQAELGLMESNYQKIGEEFFTGKDTGDTINFLDTLAVKARLKYKPLHFLEGQAEFVYAGLVADTHWSSAPIGSVFDDVGVGNRIEVKGGLTGTCGSFALMFNALYRVPVIGPVDWNLIKDGERNLYMDYVQNNPFNVTSNREALTLEAIVAFDLEPASWVWEWNAADIEGALFASTLSARYSIFEGASDPGKYKSEEGRTYYMGWGFPETRGNFNIAWRAFFNPSSDLRFVNVFEFLREHPNNGMLDSYIADHRETITGFSESLKIRYKRLVFGGSLVKDLWGPVGMNRDWNQTYPWRWSVETAFAFTPRPSLMDNGNRIGIRWAGVKRDMYSPGTGAFVGQTGNPNPGYIGEVDTNELTLFFDLSF